MKKRFPTYLFLFISLFCLPNTFAQSTQQKKLEKQRLELQRQINQINKQLDATRNHKNAALDVYEQINRKITIRRKLISNLRREINGISHQINNAEKKIKVLSKEIDVLKKNYARMIRQSYNSRSRESKLYFLFSSEGFYQAFKRMQYLKQYNRYRKKQGEKILQKKDEQVLLKVKLEKNRQSKRKLYKNYKKEEAQIRKEKEKQLAIVDKIKKEEKTYLKQIRAKQKKQAKIDKMIDDLIKKAIVKSNRKVRKSNRKTDKFFLTSEGRKLANQFSKNRGALPWPIKKAYISRKFGKGHHEIYKNIPITSSGIHLSTEKGSKARAVFGGTVLQIQVVPGANSSVFIKHGNYLTIYGNLKDITVTPGQKVKTKQIIGTVATDPLSHKTELKFKIYKNTTKLDPEKWLQKR